MTFILPGNKSESASLSLNVLTKQQRVRFYFVHEHRLMENISLKFVGDVGNCIP